jgi:hypothetical protein
MPWLGVWARARADIPRHSHLQKNPAPNCSDMRLLMRLDEIRVKTQTPTALFPTQKKLPLTP